MAATIENLPPKLLLKIFSHYINSEGRVKFLRNVRPVCKSWRDLSPAPSLWNIVHIRDWNYAQFLSEGGFLSHTQSLQLHVPCTSDRRECQVSLDANRLSGVLSSVLDLKSLEISGNNVDVDTMRIIAQHCPNLERLHMEEMSGGEFKKMTLEELDPVLTACGPTLKYLHFVACELGDTDDLYTEVAAKCPSLMMFEWRIN